MWVSSLREDDVGSRQWCIVGPFESKIHKPVVVLVAVGFFFPLCIFVVAEVTVNDLLMHSGSPVP